MMVFLTKTEMTPYLSIASIKFIQNGRNTLWLKHTHGQASGPYMLSFYA
jgi:hypothetical protein